MQQRVGGRQKHHLQEVVAALRGVALLALLVLGRDQELDVVRDGDGVDLLRGDGHAHWRAQRRAVGRGGVSTAHWISKRQQGQGKAVSIAYTKHCGTAAHR